jgi:signal transduction histidine kinase
MERKSRPRKTRAGTSARQKQKSGQEASGAELTPNEVVGIGAMAHDMKTPIAIMLASAELLIDTLQAESDIRFAGMIQRQSTRLAMMVDEINEYIRLASGQQDFNVAPVILRDLIQEVYEDFKLLQPGRRLEIKAPRHTIAVACDREKIRRVLENMLSNAFRNSPDDTEVTVLIEPMAAQGEVVVKLIDQGQPVPKALRERVFEPFFRLTDKGPGQGLGLFSVKALIEGHGGRVWADASGANSVFCFALPFANETP